jgi:S-(hydroxymethyl)glutathione dehydrogenase/alcohol dehydrogenase
MRGVLYDGEQLLVSDRLEVIEPGHDQIVVRIGAAGVCHSDISMINGTVGSMIPAPFVLGHEGAGVVEAVGSHVTTVQTGDHVVLTTIDNCGRCDVCVTGHPTLCQNSKLAKVMARAARSNQATSYDELPAFFRLDGKPILGMANTGVFAERVVVNEGQAIAIDKRVPFTSACLIGCALLTGTGAVFNRAHVYRGDSVAVIGVGGIGISVIQAARIAGATKIIAVDALASKEAMARQFGATDFVDARATDATAAVVDMTGGVDYSFECVGAEATMTAAIDMLGPGGSTVILGVGGRDLTVPLAPFKLYQNKSVLGCRYGAARAADDIPALVDLYLQGRLLLDEMVTAVYPLEDVRRAFDDLDAGKLARGVLTFDK